MPFNHGLYMYMALAVLPYGEGGGIAKFCNLIVGIEENYYCYIDHCK